MIGDSDDISIKCSENIEFNIYHKFDNSPLKIILHP